ncbi:MAG: hypothetical protein KatS3mg110_1089 [Pirellulaceae bacterium]|nr:MAG: hypothetical protein KatS3mg110_1089 [Pirellulaceae bacterium]
MQLLNVLAFVLLTVLCWGNYGPLMHEGQHAMQGSLRPFICVGFAYFLIAVLIPWIWLVRSGEKGRWSLGGIVWSTLAGAVGALGALGVIMAFKFRGSPVYVMPLVFGGAPVVNTVVTMLMSRTFHEARPIFYAGVLAVALGAAGVLYFQPRRPQPAGHAETARIPIRLVQADGTADQLSKEERESRPVDGSPAEQQAAAPAESRAAPQPPATSAQVSRPHWVAIIASVLAAALCWGSYGPVLHRGQMLMGGSRLRPFLCVGVAYFFIAVVAPWALLPVFQEAGGWNVAGILWSLAGGAAGAVGALGVILAFNFGGRPVFVMPLVFGGAPIVNTLTTVIREQTYNYVTLPFFVSLAVVIAGAVTVLVFAPRPGHAPAPSAVS